MTRYAFCASSTLFFCLWYLLYWIRMSSAVSFLTETSFCSAVTFRTLISASFSCSSKFLFCSSCACICAFFSWYRLSRPFNISICFSSSLICFWSFFNSSYSASFSCLFPISSVNCSLSGTFSCSFFSAISSSSSVGVFSAIVCSAFSSSFFARITASAFPILWFSSSKSFSIFVKFFFFSFTESASWFVRVSKSSRTLSAWTTALLSRIFFTSAASTSSSSQLISFMYCKMLLLTSSYCSCNLPLAFFIFSWNARYGLVWKISRKILLRSSVFENRSFIKSPCASIAIWVNCPRSSPISAVTAFVTSFAFVTGSLSSGNSSTASALCSVMPSPLSFGRMYSGFLRIW